MFDIDQLATVRRYTGLIQQIASMQSHEKSQFTALRQFYNNDIVLFSWLRRATDLTSGCDVMRAVYALYQAAVVAGGRISLVVEGRASVANQQQFLNISI